MAHDYWAWGKRDKERMPLYMGYVPETFLVKAEIELRETHENKVKGLRVIKEMIETDRTLNDIAFHDDFLQQFLRQSKYDAEKAFSHLQNFVTFKKKHGSYFSQVPTEPGKFITVLPRRSPGGCAVVLIEYGKWNSREICMDDFLRISMTIFQQCLRDPLTQINGFKVIHDFKNTSFKTIGLFMPPRLHLAYQAYMNCLPSRYKEIHIINESIVFKLIWTVMKPLLSENMKRKIFFHSSQDGLLEYFPRSVLPSQYGGDLQDYYMSDWIKKASEQQRNCDIGGQPNYY